MRIVYLDQNKWIDLAKGRADPGRHPEAQALYLALDRAVREGRVAAPLSAATLIETYKIRAPERRQHLAYVQAICSQGVVFRSRLARLALELDVLLRREAGGATPPIHPTQMLSPIFWEAMADPSAGLALPEPLLNYLAAHPAQGLWVHFMETPDDERALAMRIYDGGSQALCERIEQRRAKLATENREMKGRIYAALLMIETADLFLARAKAAGLNWANFDDAGPHIVQRLFDEVPAYAVEREVVSRLEMQARSINGNDLRDMQAFGAALPYSDLVIGEKQFINLARQARLDRRFGTRLETDVACLGPWLEEQDLTPGPMAGPFPLPNQDPR